MPFLETASASRVLGLDPLVVTAVATVALAFVGIVSVITGTALAIAAWRQAGSAARSNSLQREELDTLKTQLELTRQEMLLRTQLTQAERERAEREARVNLELNAGGGSWSGGTPPHKVSIVASLVNHGPGIATGLTWGIRRGGWEQSVNRYPMTLAVEKPVNATIPVPDEAVADTSTLGRSDFPGEEFTPWARCSDATGVQWQREGHSEPVRVEERNPPE